MVGGASSRRTGTLAAFELAPYAADACGDPTHGDKEAIPYQRSESSLHFVSMACGGPFACNTSNFKAYFLHTVKSEPTISRDTAEPGKNKILLQDVEVGEIALDPGIPMDIFSPPVTYERQPEVRLTLGVSRGAPLQPTPGRTGIDSNQTAEERAIEFWNDFISLQNLWQDLRGQQCREEAQ